VKRGRVELLFFHRFGQREVSDLAGKSATLRMEERSNTAGIVVEEIVAY
jgi:hypothetical protein